MEFHLKTLSVSLYLFYAFLIVYRTWTYIKHPIGHIVNPNSLATF